MKYLLEIHHGIGDVVQFTGLIESIRKYDKKAYIAMILNKDEYKAIFEGDKRVQKFYRIDMVGLSKVELMKTVLDMRREHFDYFLISPISNHKAIVLLAILINAKSSYGEQLSGLEKINSRFISVKPEKIHIVERNANILKRMGIPFEWCFPKLFCTGSFPIQIKQKSIGICIGTSIPQKTWHLDKYMKVATHFAKKGYGIVLLGGKKEEKQYLESGLENADWINLMGRLNLMGSTMAAKKCVLVIGGDTGVLHMAAAVGTPTLTLFSCTDPHLHCPYSTNSYFYEIKMDCQYCYERGEVNNCKDYKCIEQIDAEEVIKLMGGILSDKKSELIEKYRFKK